MSSPSPENFFLSPHQAAGYASIRGQCPTYHFSGWRLKRYPGLSGPEFSSRVIHPILGKICGVLRCNTITERVGLLMHAPAEKLLAVPILAEGRWLGVLVVADKENRAGSIDDFTEADERVASLFANQAAIALENARLHREAVEKEKMEREMELAASIQKTILPETPRQSSAGASNGSLC